MTRTSAKATTSKTTIHGSAATPGGCRGDTICREPIRPNGEKPAVDSLQMQRKQPAAALQFMVGCFPQEPGSGPKISSGPVPDLFPGLPWATSNGRNRRMDAVAHLALCISSWRTGFSRCSVRPLPTGANIDRMGRSVRSRRAGETLSKPRAACAIGDENGRSYPRHSRARAQPNRIRAAMRAGRKACGCGSPYFIIGA